MNPLLSSVQSSLLLLTSRRTAVISLLLLIVGLLILCGFDASLSLARKTSVDQLLAHFKLYARPDAIVAVQQKTTIRRGLQSGLMLNAGYLYAKALRDRYEDLQRLPIAVEFARRIDPDEVVFRRVDDNEPAVSSEFAKYQQLRIRIFYDVLDQETIEAVFQIQAYRIVKKSKYDTTYVQTQLSPEHDLDLYQAALLEALRVSATEHTPDGVLEVEIYRSPDLSKPPVSLKRLFLASQPISQ